MRPLLRNVSCTAGLLLGALVLASCSAPAAVRTQQAPSGWSRIQHEAQGQTVSLWMFGGDEQGNRYVDDVLAPAVAEAGVTLRRVPVADTKDAVSRILAERQAGVTDGAVDLVWVNGDNFRTGKQAGAWLCGWPSGLPNATLLDPHDPLLASDFGTPVDDCESPWHRAQFTLVYDAAKISDPPSTMTQVLDWAQAHPGRFTYPAPPDFTGSVFVREALIAVAGGAEAVPTRFDQAAYDQLTSQLFERLNDLETSLWRSGTTYPTSGAELDKLFAGGEVSMTMTYGPATLTELVNNGTFPPSTQVLPMTDGTVGNTSFLAIPASSPHAAGAQVVANVALSPEQQIAKATTRVWGQFPVLDPTRISPGQRRELAMASSSAVVPPYEELSANAHSELAAPWVPALDEGWRRNVLAG